MYELAEVFEQAERDEGLYQARSALEGVGSDECLDCGEEIPAARRAVIPSANRCIDCQEQQERNHGQ